MYYLHVSAIHHFLRLCIGDILLQVLREPPTRKAELEAIEYITAAINLIRKIFELAFGEASQSNEMTPLFNYALLLSGLSHMRSVQEYIQHYLCDIPSSDVQFLDSGRSIALSHFTDHVSSLSRIFDRDGSPETSRLIKGGGASFYAEGWKMGSNGGGASDWTNFHPEQNKKKPAKPPFLVRKPLAFVKMKCVSRRRSEKIN
jgi:hypothetical protein